MMLYSETNSNVHYKMMYTAKSLLNNDMVNIVHIAEKDEYIDIMKKNLYDLIDGPRYDSYIIKRMEG